jgi:hypothetical protein
MEIGRQGGIPAIYRPASTDIRKIAEVLEPNEWEVYSSAIRWQSRLSSLSGSLSLDELRDCLRGFMNAQEGRAILSRFSSNPGKPYVLYKRVALPDEEIRSVVQQHGLSPASQDNWIRIFTGAKASPSTSA